MDDPLSFLLHIITFSTKFQEILTGPSQSPSLPTSNFFNGEICVTSLWKTWWLLFWVLFYSHCLLLIFCVLKTSNYGLREIWWQLGSSRVIRTAPRRFFWAKIERFPFTENFDFDCYTHWEFEKTYQNFFGWT